MMELRAIHNTALLYTDMDECASRACIGHLRGDFGGRPGEYGVEFHTTWWPHMEELKSPEFVSELQEVVDTLRKKGGPLHDNRSMMRFCCKTKGTSLGDRGFGYWFESSRYAYAFRLNPKPGDYNFYIYCYSKACADFRNSEE